MLSPERIVRGTFVGFVGKAEPTLPGRKSEEFFSADLTEFEAWCSQQNTPIKFFSRFRFSGLDGLITEEDQEGRHTEYTFASQAYKRIRAGGEEEPWVVGEPVEDIHHIPKNWNLNTEIDLP